MGIFNRLAGNLLGQSETLESLGIKPLQSGQGKAASNAARYKLASIAFDAVASAVMLADENMQIVHVNPSALRMLLEAEADIRNELPVFNARTLVGSSIDIFHKNPSHQHAMLNNLSSSTNTKIVVGGRTFNLIATPLFSDEQQRIGTVVEWQDITATLTKEINEQDLLSTIQAVDKSLGVIEFNTDGTVRTANKIFLDLFNYSLAEIQGRSHSMFVDAALPKTQEYKLFWEKLNNGQLKPVYISALARMASKCGFRLPILQL